ncbi:hypothetical protein NHX12_020259 [Muraenolepis orangiensis]|uniref:Uncharacterized protein n=1 Tax=Muraenolepis orangiensis TaxID=630683 RepID=A0A9Q0IVM8_9TELE|nr:hypothetical protein NHX12_020259 [Muraenolepis orangiensis]
MDRCWPQRAPVPERVHGISLCIGFEWPCGDRAAETALRRPRCGDHAAETTLRRPRCGDHAAETALGEEGWKI